MRKTVSIITVTLVLFSMMVLVGGCKKKSGVTGVTAELFALLPANSTGVVAINFKKIAGLPSFDKMVKEMEAQKAAAKLEAEVPAPAPVEGVENAAPEGEATPAEGVEPATTEGAAAEGEVAEGETTPSETPAETVPEVTPEPEMFESYSDFVQKTGVNPKTDIIAVAMAFTGKMSMSGDADVLIVIQVNYKKDTIMNFINSQGARYTEEVYNTISMYKFADSKGKDKAFAFINDKTLAAGKPEDLKQVIDLSKGTGKSIMTNEAMIPHFKKFKSDAMAAFVFEIPVEARKVSDNPMMKFDFTKAEALIGNFDYSSGTFMGEMILVSKNKAANEQIVTVLNGFKAMGAMGGPDVVERLNNVNLTANDESVVLKLSITEALAEKLQKKMGEKKATPMGM